MLSSTLEWYNASIYWVGSLGDNLGALLNAACFQRSFLRHVVLPSSHKPHHDGLDWNEEDVLGYKDKLRTIPV